MYLKIDIQDTCMMHDAWIWIFNKKKKCCLQYGYQNLDLDPTILQFYDLTCPKQSGTLKDLCDRLRLVESYNSDDPKRYWFIVIFFNLTKDSVGPKWRIISQ